jgi:hypothetical protein
MAIADATIRKHARRLVFSADLGRLMTIGNGWNRELYPCFNRGIGNNVLSTISTCSACPTTLNVTGGTGGIMKQWGVYLLAALGIGIYGAVTEVGRDETGTIIDGGTIDAFHMRVGDCFDDTSASSGDISSLPGVPCSEPHDNETFAVFNIKQDNFPAGDAMDAIAYDGCMAKFEPFVGRDYESSSLEIFPIYPTADSWAQDDREVVCALYNMEENKLQGSMQGLAQ